MNRRIRKTYQNENEFLTFLDYPEIPIHNNDAELGARAQVRCQDVSLFTKNESGTKAVDFYLTIVKTADKLGINPFEYVYDLIAGMNDHIALSEMIRWKNNKTTG